MVFSSALSAVRTGRFEEAAQILSESDFGVVAAEEVSRSAAYLRASEVDPDSEEWDPEEWDYCLTRELEHMEYVIQAAAKRAEIAEIYNELVAA